MKILASDYDGTLNVGGVVSKENIEAIQKWRAAGNLFGMISGRNLGSLKLFMDKDNVPYDFLVGCNGAVVTDAEGNAVGDNYIPAYVAMTLLCEIHRYEAHYVSASYDWGSTYASADSKIGMDESVLLIDGERVERVYQVSGYYPDPAHALSVRNTCEALFPGQIKGLMPGAQGIDFVRVGTNKAEGIRNLVKSRGIAPELILTVGDGENDLDMLTAPDFCGYAMQNAMPAVLEKVSRTTKSVAALIEEYL
ncbi:MAG: HAD hydrolase family protein [Clostridia bacterium]|nr:HAD hydrolase family protein [Clostridia bacterium]